MNGLTLLFTAFAYAAIAIFIVGFLARVWKYAATPALLKIVPTPGPTNSLGVYYRMVQEVGLFKSLFYSNKIIWLGGYIMHLGLALILIKHLKLFFVSTPPALSWITTFEAYAGFLFFYYALYIGNGDAYIFPTYSGASTIYKNICVARIRVYLRTEVTTTAIAC